MSIEIRACRPGEQGAVASLVNRVFRPDGGDMRVQYPLLFAPDNLEGLRIAVEDGKPIAHVGVCTRDALLLGARLRVAGIGAVCTDPRHRGHGLASELMADARDHTRRCGASLMLISGGRGLYHRLGYVTVGRFDQYQLGPEHLRNINRDVEVGAYDDGDLTAVIALQQAEPIRFIRSATDWRAVLKPGMLMNRSAELLIVRRRGHPLAYAAIQKPSAPIKEPPGPVHIAEFAGSRSAFVAALPAVLARYQTTRVSLLTQPSDVEFSFHARQHGWMSASQAFPGTLGGIDPPALMAALTPVLAERAEAAARLTISSTAEGATFSLDGERYQVAAPGPLAALLFGGDTEEARAVPASAGALGALLRKLFPLPLLWQGYNYV